MAWHQWVLLIFGVGALMLTFAESRNTRRWAPVLGLLSQPGWLVAAWSAGQPGVMVMSLAYAAAWMFGLVKLWRSQAALRGETGSCPNCGGEDFVSADGDWHACQQCSCTWDQAERTDEIPWRCYHCGEVCHTYEAAHEHFGQHQICDPICHVDRAKFREMEARDERHGEEDTELHREIYRLKCDHAIGLRREEEKGYARGLADARAHPESLGLQRVQESITTPAAVESAA